jgi:hypothetical protein
MSSWLNNRPINKQNIKNASININIENNNTDIIKDYTNINFNILPMYSNIYNPRLLYKTDNKLISNIIENYNKYIPHVKKIVNVYQNVYKNNNLAPGLGDFIRGTICLYQLCNICNIEFDINIKSHQISEFIIIDDNQNKLDISIQNNIIFDKNCNNMNTLNTYTFYKKSLNILFSVFSNSIIIDNILYICNNSYPYFQIDIEEYSYIKQKLLCFKDNIIEEGNKILSKFNYNIKQYDILQIRYGDNYMNKNINKNNDIYSIIHNIIIKYELYNNNNIIVSDNNEINNYISKVYNNFKSTSLIISHTGEDMNNNINEIKNTIIELYLVCNSKSIISLSSYLHGSGFTLWPALCNNIKYECGNIK